MSDSQTHHVGCSFAAKQTGGEKPSFWIALEPTEALPGLPERCIIGLSLSDPKSRKLAEQVEKFLQDNLAGISITK